MIKILDCTLRDGAYIVEGKFGDNNISGIIKKLEDARIDVIECGWLKDSEYKDDYTYFHMPSDIEKHLSHKKDNVKYSVMIDYNRYDLSKLPIYDGKSIDIIRVVFPHGKVKEGVDVAKEVAKKGYKVYIQAANTLSYDENDIKELCDAVNSSPCECLNMVDTFGAMYDKDVIRIATTIDRYLDKNISLGIHTHNNQQLAFANAITFINTLKDSKRDLSVDASLCGMGRGAGNVTTELLTNYLNKNYDTHYDLDSILDAIDTYMTYFEENFKWGYSTEYSVAGMYCTHVNNIAYLLKNHRASARDIRDVLDSMDSKDRVAYDYDLLEKKYVQNQSRKIDDKKDVDIIYSDIKDREIVLIAPGKTSIDDEDNIKKYIKDKNAISIAVNVILPIYDYDYLYFANNNRYEYAKTSYKDIFDAKKKIILSNINATGDDNEYIINYDRAMKIGYPHFDNAVISILRLLDDIGIKKVSISGFDGFKHRYNESYGDAFLPTLNPDGKWDELNTEIKDMYRDFIQNAKNLKDIYFITDTIFS